MKFCKVCKVNVNKEFDNCPICGSYLDKNNDKTLYPDYEERMDGKVTIKRTNINRHTDFLKTKFNYLMLTAMAVCVALNFLLTPKSWWSVYVVLGGVLLMYCIIMPFADKSKIVTQIYWDIPIVTAVCIAGEFAISGTPFGFTTVRIILPLMYALSIILVDLIIFFGKNKETGNFVCLLYLTAYAIVPEILVWAMSTVESSMYSFVVFFFALCNLLIMYIICSKELTKDFKSKFNL